MPSKKPAPSESGGTDAASSATPIVGQGDRLGRQQQRGYIGSAWPGESLILAIGYGSYRREKRRST